MPPKTKKPRVEAKPAAKAAGAKKPAAKAAAADAIKPDAAAAAAPPAVSVAAAPVSGTLRLRLEKYSKMKTDVLSEVVEIGGYPWQLRVTPPEASRRRPHFLYLTCLYSKEARIWYARSTRKCRLMNRAGVMEEVQESRFELFTAAKEPQTKLFTAAKPTQLLREVVDLNGDKKAKFAKNDTVELEVEVEVAQPAGDRFNKRPVIDFLTASSEFDGAITVGGGGGTTVHVNVQLLSAHSAVLADHISKRAEQNMEDVDVEAFVDFLNLLHRTQNTVIATNAERVLQLAERFKVQCLVDHIEKFLFLTDEVKASDKLRIAEKHALSTLKRGALIDIGRDETHLKEVHGSAAFKEFSAKLKREIKDAVLEGKAKRAESDDDLDGFDDSDFDDYY